jgi:hypothetical protein
MTTYQAAELFQEYFLFISGFNLMDEVICPRQSRCDFITVGSNEKKD